MLKERLRRRVKPTTTSRALHLQPRVGYLGKQEATRVSLAKEITRAECAKIEQTTVVDPQRSGRSAGRLDPDELSAIDEALALVLEL